MKIAVAQIMQETNTFNPIVTGLDSFEQNGLYIGPEVLKNMRGIGEIGGFLTLLEKKKEGIELVPILRAWSMSGGRVTMEALKFFEKTLVSVLRKSLPIDGIFISLHGAAASEKIDDFEGYLLRAVRGIIGDDVPLVVSLDHHANITGLIIDSVDALVGYQTLPHDPFETGIRAGKILLSIINNEITPTIGWQKIPMLAPADRGSTSEWPMKEWFDFAREMEKKPGVVSASTFPVQPWLDVQELGWSVVVVTDNDQRLAELLSTELSNRAWEMREAFWKVRRIPSKDAIKQAAKVEGPILICDASDSVLSGSTGDSTCLLKEMLEQKIDCLALLPIVDQEVVDKAIEAGLGSEIALRMGGKLDKLFGDPVKLVGKVGGISKQRLKSSFPGWGFADMGKTVLIEVGSIKLLVSERVGAGGTDPDIYRYFDVEPAEARIIVVKTYFHYQKFRSILKDVIMADCPGLSGWDLRQFSWEKAPRPIFPLDDISEWKAIISRE